MEIDSETSWKFVLVMIGANLIAALLGLIAFYFFDVLVGIAVFTVALISIPVLVQYRFLKENF